MKKSTLAVALLILSAHAAEAQFLQARFVTSAYAWQQHDTLGSSSNHLYGFQTAQFSITQNDFTLSTYLQGWNDFAGPLKNDPKIRWYNLYLKWRNIADVGELTVGRQPVFAGVGIGTIDGAKASINLFEKKVRALGYYGALPPPGLKGELVSDPGKNSMFGAQVTAWPLDLGQVSLSYMNRQIQPESYTALRRDSLFNPTLVEIRPSASIEELVSLDLSGEYKFFYGYLRYDHDVKFETMSRFQFFSRVKPMERVGITAEYLQREPRISYNSIFSVFTYNSLKEYEVGLEYEPHFLADIQVFSKYGEVSFGDETSTHMTFGFNSKYVSASATSMFGYNGKINAASVNAGYPLLDKTLTPTASFTYGYYKLNRYQAKRDVALSGSLGIVYRPMPLLSVDTQLQWIQNKIYSNDVRFFLRASFFLNEKLNVF